MGYPAILKPPIGSWGRLLSKINDRDAAEAILEHKEILARSTTRPTTFRSTSQAGSRHRAFVVGDETICAIYRYSKHWITNTARGGISDNCPVTPELDRICRAAARAVGGGAVAIDLIEAGESFTVIEVNYTMEFRNRSRPRGSISPGRYVDFVLESVRGDGARDRRAVVAMRRQGSAGRDQPQRPHTTTK
jgi:[lysine-biosynthesis-protein LysW]--L-2-aminoadipate ligase